MPELPEVETVVRTVTPRLLGRTIRSAEIFPPHLVCKDPSGLSAGAAGRRVVAVRRHGKHILIDLTGGAVLALHLGMTGKLLSGGQCGPHTRARFALDDGVLLFEDIRQFGKVEFYTSQPEWTGRLGPDPLAVTEEEFALLLRSRRARVKALLLDQAFLRGMGNIYTDEVLFEAGIHPQAIASRLSRRRAGKLYQALQNVLVLAIERGGSSISDYVDADGRKGSFQLLHQVYGKTGQPCPRCGRPIRRVIVAGRGTHYCPGCQRS